MSLRLSRINKTPPIKLIENHRMPTPIPGDVECDVWQIYFSSCTTATPSARQALGL
jgi:hypothetical protein